MLMLFKKHLIEKHDFSLENMAILSCVEVKYMDKKNRSLVFVGILCLSFILLAIALYQPFSQWISNSPSLKNAGVSGAFLLVFGVVAQIILAFLPGEPLEIMAGVLYGPWLGLLLCMVGALIGSIIVYGLVKKLGMPLVSKFFKEKDINQFKFLHNEKRLFSVLFIIFLIPGVPKDILTYLMPLTTLNLSQFLIITTIARIPSIITSTIGGGYVASHDYHLAVITFIITAIITFIGLKYYHSKTKKAHVN